MRFREYLKLREDGTQPSTTGMGQVAGRSGESPAKAGTPQTNPPSINGQQPQKVPRGPFAVTDKLQGVLDKDRPASPMGGPTKLTLTPVPPSKFASIIGKKAVQGLNQPQQFKPPGK